MRARLASPGVLLAALCVLACQDDTVECLQDDRCPSGAYCRNTRCIEPGADGGVMEVYRSRVMPLIEAGCNCHGPASDRPWRFDHRTEESTAASLAELRNWMYNPRHAWRARLPDAEPPPEPPEGAIDRFALVGYAAAQCGFEHPLIWPPGAPQNVELAAWFARAIDEIDRPPPFADPPLTRDDAPALAEGPLPEREQALYDRAVAVTAGLDGEGAPPMSTVFEPIDGYTVANGGLAARVSGQCGCCHVPPRGFVVPPFDPAQGWVAHGQETFCDMDRVMPGHLVTYGLGTSGRARHPVVYADVDDPRLRLLVKWFDHIDRTRPPLDAGAPPDPCNPPVDAGPDLGPDLGDGDVGPPPDPAEVALAAYMGPIGRLLEQRCGNDFCHDASSPSFPHPYPFADDEAARTGLRRLIALPGLLDLGAPASSALIRVGAGDHATNFGGQAFSAADVDPLVEWIGGIPPDF